ncbi:MAG TPA: carboxypeptidase regulatory-like domain-containing protein, partial [Candidatus Acidoferrum sp.]|nr:carboxypeptidase regulatory-like domain-containing protein [Candidatus Acidoferrum sp.]
MSNRCLLLCAFTCLLFVFSTNAAISQSLTSGDITGIVTDPSGAAISNAEVTLKNSATGATQTHATNDQGSYRFSLLSPGAYTVSVSASGFQVTQQTASITVGQTITLNVQVQLSSSTQTVEVTAGGEVVQTDNADLTTSFSADQITQVPNPGNDLSYIVQTSPGAVMNTQGGYGNSATFGLPATSNLFTVDGMDENDPFLNLNNSGATNLLLGQNDIDQATVVNNGYSGQYGGLAGANVNYVTKSGSDKWHGNTIYWWNGRTMNANNYFNNLTGTPRPFDNANQWAASLGGPIRKDKTFFFVNTEGVRVLLPTSTKVNIPSPQFEAATLTHLLTSPASIPFYNGLFSLWNNASGAKGAKDVLPLGTVANAGDGCGTFTGLG